MNDSVDRAAVFGETAMASERIAPGFAAEREVAEHLARYRWAAGQVSELRVLDAACGVGYGAPILRDRGAHHVTSVDLSEEALAFGSTRYALTAVRADATRLPFPAGAYDAIVSLETIEHVPDPSAVLTEFARVLRSGGLLVCSCPNISLSKRNNPYHLSEMTWRELRSRLEDAGFEMSRLVGQHGNVLGGALWRIRGVARLARAIDRSPRVGRMPMPRSEPKVFCVTARKRA